jgi:excisionase family DNA binding protein
MTNVLTSPGLLTVAEAHNYLKVSRASLYRLMAAGELEWVQIGARRRFTQAAIDKFIAAHGGVAA